MWALWSVDCVVEEKALSLDVRNSAGPVGMERKKGIQVIFWS